MPSAFSNANTKIIYMPTELSGKVVEAFFGELHELLQSAPASIVLDCARIDRVLPGHIGTIWHAHIKCIERGVPVNIGSVSTSLERILKSLDLYDYLVSDECALPGPKIEKNTTLSTLASPQLQMSFDASVEDINAAMDKFQCFLKGLNISEILEFELAVVFYEVATNIRLHGRTSRVKAIQLSVAVEATGLILRFDYGGPEFDPTTRGDEYDPGYAIRSKQRRGLGIAMIKRMVDGMSYIREEGNRNVLTLEKRLHINGGVNDDCENSSK